MKLYLKQRFLTLLDSFDIYNEQGQAIFHVKGVFGIGHNFEVYNKYNELVGEIKQKFPTLLYTFEIYKNGRYEGYIKKEFTLLRPSFEINYKNWRMNGNLLEWDYEIYQGREKVAEAHKELFKLTDTYSIDVYDESDVVDVVMLVVAIDAVKCSQRK